MPQTLPNITLRRADERGHTDIGWLDSRHSFSFGEYHDADHMAFRSLRVINDDIVAPSTGFGEHPHRDMEIITWVLDGELKHRDSLGNGAVLGPGELQYMSAGRGIRHSEFNASDKDPVHLLQIWIMPRTRGIEPRYGQVTIDRALRQNRFHLVAAGDGREGVIPIEQDAVMAIANLDAGKRTAWHTQPTRHLYVHVARGTIELLGQTLKPGDAAMISEATTLDVSAIEDAEVLLFDMA